MSRNIEKEILAAQYESIVRSALQNKKESQKPKVYKKVIGGIGSFLLSCFFTWCSSGDTSYFPKLFSENIVVRTVVCFLPLILFLIYEFAIIISIKGIVKDIDFEYDMSMCSWKNRFTEYILKKLNYEKSSDFNKNMHLIEEKMKTCEDIVFDEYDFSNYLREYYKKYNYDFYYDFYSHLAKVILLENEINGTLFFNEGTYTYIVKENRELLFMSVRNL